MLNITYKRQCDNWLATYRDWIFDRSQMRTELIDWSGIFTLAVVLERKVMIPKEYLGSWTCYPFLYVIVVGPSGVGKTTAIKYSFDLTDQVPSLAKPVTLASIEGIIDELINAPNNAVYLSVEELEDIFTKDYNRRMFGFLTSLYDGKVALRQKTLKRDLEFADKPCLNMFGGTTPNWVADNIPQNVLNGGFGSRVLWLYVPGLRRRKMYYKAEMKEKDYHSIEKKLLADLIHISTLEGEYAITDDAMKYVEEWNSTIPETVKYDKIKGYIERKSVFVHKVAMIMHAAYSDSMELNLLDFKNAITLVENLEPNLPNIFIGVGKNEYALDMRDIAKYILEHPNVKDSDLRSRFETTATPAKLNELIEGLLVAEVIKSDLDENNKRTYTIVED